MAINIDDILTEAVTETDDGRFDFACPGFRDSRCGDNGIPFTSTGWPSRETAELRGLEHFDDHRGIAPMTELAEFRARHGVETTADGVAVLSIKDI